MKFRTIAVAAATAAAALSAHAATNLVQDGSFEDAVVANGNWKLFTTIPGWTGTPNIEVRNNNAGQAQDGNKFVELDTDKPFAGNGACCNSGIYQNVALNAGKYLFSFWYSARPHTKAGTDNLTYSFAGLSGSVLDGVGNDTNANQWQHFSQYVTVAAAGIYKLAFAAAGTPDTYGGSLDNVSVTAVPEPQSLAMMLAGLGIIGTIARKRKSA